jgi:hypothetical protein
MVSPLMLTLSYRYNGMRPKFGKISRVDTLQCSLLLHRLCLASLNGDDRFLFSCSISFPLFTSHPPTGWHEFARSQS